MHSVKITVFAAAAGVVLAGLGVHSPAAANCDNCLVGDEMAIWQQTDIPVCWESMDSAAHDRQVVQDAITESWQAHSGLTFTGWGQCQANDLGIRIAVSDSYWPKVLNFGSFIDGIEGGMRLNFELGQMDGFQDCAAKRDYCNKAVAIHEFGHAIGFHHEQNRSDRDLGNACIKEEYQGGVPNEKFFGRFDNESIMNYCSPTWSGGGKLSALDIEGVGLAYPK